MKIQFLFPFLASLSLNYPGLEKEDVRDNYHGITVLDPYRFLEDSKDERTQNWVEAQEKLTQDYLSSLPGSAQIDELLEKANFYDRQSTPSIVGEKHFYLYQESRDNQPKLYFEEDGIKKVLLDPNLLSEEGTLAISDYEPSLDGRYVAVMVSSAGSDWQEIWILDAQTGEKLDSTIEWVKFSKLAWDENGFFYSRYPAPDQDPLKTLALSQSLYYHRVGTSPINDSLIYQDLTHPTHRFYVSTFEKGRYLALTIANDEWRKYAIYLKDQEKPEEPFKPIVDKFENYNFIVAIHEGKIYLRTNKDAPYNTLLEVDLEHPEHARPLLPEKKDEILSHIFLCGETFVAVYEKDAQDHVELYNLEGKFLKRLPLPHCGQVLSLSGQKSSPDFFLQWTSFTKPSEIYKYSLTSGELSSYYSPNLPLDLSHYETEQLFYKSGDGTQVPLFLVRKASSSRKPSPTLLTAYGGFAYSFKPHYSPLCTAFLEMGGTIALANIRGGGEYGEAWHLQGNLENKQNGFDDFIAAALFLTKEGITTRDQLATIGASNGGLLVAAAMLQRPDLFKAVVPRVGVLDMFRFHLFTIGWLWTAEYGASYDPHQFTYLYRYSPLHNVKKGMPYPSTLIMTGDHDDRVVPAHSYKFAATMQEKNGSQNPILLRIDRSSGHGAGKPLHKRQSENRDILLFLNKELKLINEKQDACKSEHHSENTP